MLLKQLGSRFLIQSKIHKKILDDISAVTSELNRRGFSADVIAKFLEKCAFHECLDIIDTIQDEALKLDKKKKKRLVFLMALCALRDRRRIFYWLKKKNVRTKFELESMAHVYRIKFEDRCPKIVNTALKAQANRRLLAQIRSARTTRD